VGESRRLAVAADVDRLAEIRSFVRDAVADFGGSKRLAADLVQAVDEAACNAIVHGYRGRPGEIEVEAAVRDRRVEIRILDRCPVFDPTTAANPDPRRAPRPTRSGGMGVGIQLLRSMAGEVRHHVRPGGGNVLTLVHAIDGPGDEEG